jgi:hypothetical protein
MNQSAKLRPLVLAYLLGELSPEEHRAIEERMLVDRAFADQLQGAEYDLIGDYQAHRLNEGERGRVEQAFTREQLSLRSSAAPDTPASRRSWRRSGTWLWVSLAVAVTLAVAGWLIAFRSLPWRAGLGPIGRASSTLPLPGAGNVPMPSANIGQSADNGTVVLLLTPTVARSTDSAALELRPLIHSVHVRWIVPPNVSARRFRLTVLQNGKLLTTVRQHDALQEIGGSHVAEFHLAATVFAGDVGNPAYRFAIRASGNPRSDVADYSVVVTHDLTE